MVPTRFATTKRKTAQSAGISIAKGRFEFDSIQLWIFFRPIFVGHVKHGKWIRRFWCCVDDCHPGPARRGQSEYAQKIVHDCGLSVDDSEQGALLDVSALALVENACLIHLLLSIHKRAVR